MCGAEVGGVCCDVLVEDLLRYLLELFMYTLVTFALLARSSFDRGWVNEWDLL